MRWRRCCRTRSALTCRSARAGPSAWAQHSALKQCTAQPCSSGRFYIASTAGSAVTCTQTRLHASQESHETKHRSYGVGQVNMMPSTMPPLVLVVATPKQARELQRRNDGQNGGQPVMWLHDNFSLHPLQTFHTLLL